MPSAQSSQSLTLSCSSALVDSSWLYVPAGHSLHSVAPAPEYVPKLHIVHTVLDDAPSDVEYLPASQGVQLLAPLASEYFAAGQSVHEVCPVLLWYLPASQLVRLLAPSTSEYLPTSQSSQPDAAVVLASENVPAMQS